MDWKTISNSSGNVLRVITSNNGAKFHSNMCDNACCDLC